MRIRTRERALRSAASVVFGRSGARLAACLALLAGCPDDGTAGGSDTGALADTSLNGDILADLADLVLGEDTPGPGADVPRGLDGAADVAAPMDVAATGDVAGDAAAPVDVASPPDAADVAAHVDVAQDAETTDTATPADVAADAGTDAVQPTDTQVADAGSAMGCLQPTGVPCSVADPCPTDKVLACFEGQCAEMDITPNETAQACCNAKYQAGEFAAPGCNPWGPPAPPAFDRVAARRALRSVA